MYCTTISLQKFLNEITNYWMFFFFGKRRVRIKMLQLPMLEKLGQQWIFEFHYSETINKPHLQLSFNIPINTRVFLNISKYWHSSFVGDSISWHNLPTWITFILIHSSKQSFPTTYYVQLIKTNSFWFSMTAIYT